MYRAGGGRAEVPLDLELIFFRDLSCSLKFFTNGGVCVCVVGVVAVAVVACAYYFGEQYATNERLKQQELAQEKIKRNVQEATFDLGTLNAVAVNASALQSESTDNDGAPLIDSDQQYYSIIAGSFRSLENANKKIVFSF